MPPVLLNPYRHAAPGGGSGTAATVTIASGTVASNLTAFITRVDLSHMPAAWWTALVAEGAGAIRVKQADTVIPFDVIWTNTSTSQGELFFRADLLAASSNVFTIEVETGATALAATDPNGRNAVWVDYDVFACGVPGVAGIINRAGGAAFTASATPPTILSDGWIDCGTAKNRWFYLAGLAKRTAFSLGISVYSQDTTADSFNKAHLSYTTQGSTANADRVTMVDDQGATRGIWNSSDSWRYYGATALTTHERRNATFNGTGATIGHVNGAAGVTDAATAVRPAGTPCDLIIGAGHRSGGEPWMGRLNYAYLRNSVLSADWIAAEDKSWRTPASFYTVSS